MEECSTVLNPLLQPLVENRYQTVKGKKFISILEEQVEMSPNFRLYLSTKLPNPQFSPEIYIRCTVVNFLITEDSLHEQLLAYAVTLELPDDDKIKREISGSIQEDRLLLKKSEEKILELLTNSRGMILDDIELIESLKVSKEIAKAVNDKIIASMKKEEEINKGLELYDPVA